jgi:hypothetical protein
VHIDCDPSCPHFGPIDDWTQFLIEEAVMIRYHREREEEQKAEAQAAERQSAAQQLLQEHLQKRRQGQARQ